MYQDNEPDLVEQRDRAEKLAVAGDLALPGVRRVLDIGCGVGRWGWFLAAENQEIVYEGIDFSSTLIDMARREADSRGFPQLSFQTMAATRIDPSALAPAYDLVLIAGLLMYLNDTDCLKVLVDAGQLTAAGGRVYVREPVGVGERFTLNRFYSEELAHEYSAIYRSTQELEQLVDNALLGQGFRRLKGAYLFPEHLEKRVETRQYYIVLEKD